MSNYKRLNEIETELRTTNKETSTDKTVQLITEALNLASQETQIAGRVLQYSILLDYAHLAGEPIYLEVKKRFITTAISGHGWKMERMFKITKDKAASWGDNELNEFCTERIKELKAWKKK